MCTGGNGRHDGWVERSRQTDSTASSPSAPQSSDSASSGSNSGGDSNQPPPQPPTPPQAAAVQLTGKRSKHQKAHPGSNHQSASPTVASTSKVKHPKHGKN